MPRVAAIHGLVCVVGRVAESGLPRRAATRARHFPDKFGALARRSFGDHVGLSDDPGATATIVNDRHAADLMLLHRRDDIIERSIRTERPYLPGQDAFRSRALRDLSL